MSDPGATGGKPSRSIAAAQLAIAVAVVAIASWLIPALERRAQPADYTDLVAGGWSQRMTNEPAEVLFVGNSVAQWGVDVDLFEQLAGRNTELLWAGASASAWWYLVLDRFIATADPRPGLVVLCFADNTLTMTSVLPGPQAVDRIKALLDEEDERSGTSDRVLESSHSRTLVLLERHWSLVETRSSVRRTVEGTVKGYVAALAGRPAAAVDSILARVFDLTRKDTAVLARAESSTAASVDPRLYDFERMKNRSFLPDIVEVAAANQLELVFVRMPRRITPGRQPDPAQEAALQQYMVELERYLTGRGFVLLDLSGPQGLSANDFAHGDHLNPTGRTLFTRALAAALEPHLPPPSRPASRRAAAMSAIAP